MDILSLIGVVLGFAAILGGNLLEGGHASALINGPAMVIVFGGTIAAALLQTPARTFVRALRLSGKVFAPTKRDRPAMIRKLVEWGGIARKDGLLALERASDQEADGFVRKAMQLLVDGGEPEAIRLVLDMELENREDEDINAARVFVAMGGYAPTIGILGAVMGLIHVMQNLADPAMLGSGIATAFVATIYGVGLANLFLLPFGNKLKAHVLDQTQYYRMVVEGVVSIAEGENPRHIEAKLRGFL
ncbi:MAG: flagellar motor protein [Gammaproteobacteria bacterium]|nr:flagellar motor protein [Gammaproteobacteria bacterium]